ncbi:hypothetical protein [Spirosoma areae]
MKTAAKFTFALLCSLVSTICFSQSSFSSCTAAFLDNKMVVDEYTTKGRCILPSTATGKLTVCTVNLSPTESKIVDKLPFRIAIRDKNTQALLMFSRDDVKQIDVQNVLAKCRKGDHIVLLTVSNQYAMPHNEILVQ